MSTAPVTRVFTGHGQSGNWNDPNNWDGNKAASGAVTLVPMSTTMNGSFAARTLMMLGQETVTVNGAITTSSLDPCTSFMVCAGANAVFAPTSTLNVAGGIVVGARSVGTLTVQGSGSGSAHSTITSGQGKLGQLAGSAGLVNIAGGVWNITRDLEVGQAGNGVLNVTSGGLLTVGSDLVVGDNPGTTGAVSIASGGHVTVGSYTDIGGSSTPGHAGGIGSLSIGAGANLTSAGPFNIATQSAVSLGGGTLNAGNSSFGMLIQQGATLSGHGTVNINGTGSIDNQGTIDANGGTLTLNSAIGGTGKINIEANATMKITGTTLGAPVITFVGANATLALAHGAINYGTINNFVAGDQIVMAGVDQIGWNATTDVLTLSQGGHVLDNLHLTGNYGSTSPFTLTQTSAGAMITVGLHH